VSGGGALDAQDKWGVADDCLQLLWL
jgi:hypothetical protein